MQNRPPQRKKVPPKDLLLIALAILVIFRVDWGNMNSFHYLILFLLILCFMLRWSNMRKDAQRKEMMQRQNPNQEPARLTGEAAVYAEDASSDNEAVPAENPAVEAPVETEPSEEKTEE